MTQEGQLPPPPVMWAQRRGILFVTFCLEDCKNPTIDIDPHMVHFKGVGGTEKKMHEVTINLYDEIIPSKTIQNIGGRTCELVLAKAKEGPYWPKLIKENTKAHWLKSDFNKWKDEDDSEDEGGRDSSPDTSMVELMQQMSGLYGPEGKRYDDYLDYIKNQEEEEEVDSDDDDLPGLMFD